MHTDSLYAAQYTIGSVYCPLTLAKCFSSPLLRRMAASHLIAGANLVPCSVNTTLVATSNNTQCPLSQFSSTHEHEPHDPNATVHCTQHSLTPTLAK
jgi:hypothetical protein